MKFKIINEIDTDNLLFGGALYVNKFYEQSGNESTVSMQELLAVKSNMFDVMARTKVSKNKEDQEQQLATSDARDTKMQEFFDNNIDKEMDFILMQQTGFRGDLYNLNEMSIVAIKLEGNLSIGFVVDKLVLNHITSDREE